MVKCCIFDLFLGDLIILFIDYNESIQPCCDEYMKAVHADNSTIVFISVLVWLNELGKCEIKKIVQPSKRPQED